MTRREIQDLVARSNGRLCARYIHTPKGQIKTLDYTPPLVAIARRASRIAAGPLAVAMTLASASAAERRQPSEPAAAQAPADAEKKPTGPTGEVRGVVRDKDGKPIADADVTLSNDDESFDAKTNALGEYRFESVPGGAYAIRAVSQDSHTGSVENVLVIPGGSAVHDIVDFRNASHSCGERVLHTSPRVAENCGVESAVLGAQRQDSALAQVIRSNTELSTDNGSMSGYVSWMSSSDGLNGSPSA
jgi:hypothetical protein